MIPKSFFFIFRDNSKHTLKGSIGTEVHKILMTFLGCCFFWHLLLFHVLSAISRKMCHLFFLVFYVFFGDDVTFLSISLNLWSLLLLIGCLHTLRVVDFYLRVLGGIQWVKITAIKLQICQVWDHESLRKTQEGYLMVFGLKQKNDSMYSKDYIQLFVI